MGRVKIDDELEKDINDIRKSWKKIGIDLSRPAAIKIILRKYKEDSCPVPYRPPKSKKWKL